MKKHLPITIEKTLIVKYTTSERAEVSIPLSEVPNNIKIEIEILDNIRQKVADNYHLLNEAELSLTAQTHRVQKILHNVYLNNESGNQKTNK